MVKFIRFLILCCILLCGAQIIKPPVGPFSVFQLWLIITFAVSLPHYIVNSKRRGIYSVVSILWIICTLIAYITSINPNWARGSLLYGIMASLLFLIIPNYFNRNDVNLIIKTFIRSQYIVIPFSIAAPFYGVSTHIDLPFGLYIELGQEFLDSMYSTRGMIRLMLPYHTSPVLAVVMEICILLLMFSKNVFPDPIKYILVVAYSAILIFSGSRTGYVGMFAIFILISFNGDFKNILRKVNKVFLVIAIAVIVPSLYYVLNLDYVETILINRTAEHAAEGLMNDRHFLVPFDGILIWLQSAGNFLFGIGSGSSAMMKGYHTFLPPHFLCSPVTLIVESGLLGLALVFLIFKVSFKIYRYRKLLTYNEKALCYSLIACLVSSITYEIFNSFFVIFVLAVSFMLYDTIFHPMKKDKLLNA